MLHPRVERDIRAIARRMVLAPAIGLVMVCLLLLLLQDRVVAGANELAICSVLVGLGLVFFGATVQRRWMRRFALRYDAALQGHDVAQRAKREFLAMLGHELRNPLAPMKIACELARMRGPRPNDWRTIEKQVDHLTRLVDDLLDVARITQGNVVLHRQPVPVVDVLHHALEHVGMQLENRHQRVELDVAAALHVDGDPVRLAQVFSNLLANASKFSDEHATILVTARALGERVEIAVRDTGCGIDPELQEHVFEMFAQQQQSIDRSHGGLGLGLTIVRNLVGLHGGSVHVISEGRGRGSTFVVELPAAAVATPESAAIAPPSASHRRRMLVVDDNEDAADMLGELLTSLGHDVSVAYDPVSAIETARRTRPEVALLDIGLPVMDGYELARELRTAAAANGPAPRLIAVTGYGQWNDRQRSMQAGFDDHLVKPIDLDTLSRALP